MSGHSKWSNIKHRKAEQDNKRGKVFTKIIRELVTAAKIGGGDIASNPRLRTAVDKALACNMTRDTVNRAIQRGVGGDDDSNMETIIYEGYGPNGIAVMVDCLSDNRKRTVSEVRHAFTKTGGNLGTDGSVAYMFTKTGVITATGNNEDEVMEIALNAGADDVVSLDDNEFEITCAWEQVNNVRDEIEQAGLKVIESSIDMLPSVSVDITDLEEAKKLMRLVDMLEDCDDVQNVYHNAEISDEIAEQL